MLDLGRFHDFYAARAHVDWVTQAPVLMLSELGRARHQAAGDGLLGDPVRRCRRRSITWPWRGCAAMRVLLGIGIAIVAVGLSADLRSSSSASTTPPSPPPRRHGGDADDEASRRLADAASAVPARRVLRALLRGDGLSRAAARRGHRLVACARRRPHWRGCCWPASPPWPSSPPPWSPAATIAEYWTHPHFVKVRSMSFDFWQNLQFAIPLVAPRRSARRSALVRPSWLRGRGPARRAGRRAGRARADALVSAAAIRTRSSIRRRTISRARRRACCWRRCWPACGCMSPGSGSRPRSLAALRMAGGFATLRRGHDGTRPRRRHSRRRADRPVVGLSRPHARPGRQPGRHRPGRATCRCSTGRTSCSPRTGRCRR